MTPLSSEWQYSEKGFSAADDNVAVRLCKVRKHAHIFTQLKVRQNSNGTMKPTVD